MLLPFHAFLTVWGNSLVGHYTLLRLWPELLLVIAGLATIVLWLRQPSLVRKLAKMWLIRAVAAYFVVCFVWGGVAYASGQVSAKALAYGELVDLRFFVIMLVAFSVASLSPWLANNWHKLLAWPAVVVVIFGLAQWLVLPYDFLRHFGYTKATIPAYQTIDHDKNYIRIISTTRGANLLGGYLLMVLSWLGGVFTKSAKKLWLSLFVLASLGVLYASGSRGAWLGVVVAAVALLFLQVKSRRTRQLFVLIGLAGLAIILAGIVVLRDNDFVQNTFFHTDEHSTSKISSDEGHLTSSLNAAKQVATEPLGRGPGTAGPASIYNQAGPARIAEDYFLQVGQETGWLGLVLFLVIYGLTAKELLARRRLLLTQVLLAAMAGLTVMALLMHIWADPTIAFIFWALTGVALAQPLSSPGKPTK